MSIQSQSLSIFLLLFLSLSFQSFAQEKPIPEAYKNMAYDEDGKLYLEMPNGEKAYAQMPNPTYTLDQMYGNPVGNEKGIAFDFKNARLGGVMYYGLIPLGDSKHPQPVYFKESAIIKRGKAEINLLGLSGKYDMIAWEKSGKGLLGYRIINESGSILYDGKLSFKKTSSGFQVDITVTQGPTVNNVSHQDAVIAFTTNKAVKASVLIEGNSFSDEAPTTHHEIKVHSLNPNQKYDYTILYGENKQSYHFKTSPKPGTRQAFTFAYASDSRNGNGGGERNVYGSNNYIMKRIMALNTHKNASFMQFSGDLINGYLIDEGEMNLQYANWKRAVEPFAHYLPIYTSMGNHEAFMHLFQIPDSREYFMVDRFPFDTASAEKIFADNFVNPKNGPFSEDSSEYDPDEKTINFPSYEENVYHYTYDNVGVIVLNSNYWYAPTLRVSDHTGGNLHGYIMDNQLQWLNNTIMKFESDPNIDHIFVTLHTPLFPNGGHSVDDMWYSGNNSYRPVINGKKVKKGIIERRDEILQILVNQSKKLVAVLTGDEHNYNRLHLSSKTKIYPENYAHEKVVLSRPIWQINNGSAGAPYYAQEQLPWTPSVSGFTTQNVVVFFHVNGKSIEMEVMNPDTLEEVEKIKLK